MKKVCLLFCCLALLCGILLTPAAAADNPDDVATGQLGAHVTYSLDRSTGVMRVSGYGPLWMYDELQAGNPFTTEESLRMIIVEDGVTDITGFSFSCCFNLEVVVFGRSVTSVNQFAFNSCTKLRALYFMGDAPSMEEWHTPRKDLTVYHLPGTRGWDSEVFSKFTVAEFCGAPYSDVPHAAWYAPDVVRAWLCGYLNGVGLDRFAPQSSVTRAQLVTVLHRIKGCPAAPEGDSGFTDVAAGKWYSEAVAWAAAEGFVAGYPDGSFRPDQSVTRQELAVILHRVLDCPRESDDVLASYQDAADIAAYAWDAFAWAVDWKLIQGLSSGGSLRLAPRDTATRAQLAAVLMRFSSLDNSIAPVNGGSADNSPP